MVSGAATVPGSATAATTRIARRPCLAATPELRKLRRGASVCRDEPMRAVCDRREVDANAALLMFAGSRVRTARKASAACDERARGRA